MSFDGFYVIENHLSSSMRKDCLRVIRDGLTWSTLWSDVPHAIEFRDDGALYGAVSVRGPDDNELRGPLIRLGTWKRTDGALELVWPRWKERLVPEKLLGEPPLQRPRGRADELFGLVIEQHGRWEGTVELDGTSELDIETNDDLDAAFARARRIAETLRAGALDRVKQQLAAQVWDEYTDYLCELGQPAAASPAELARELRVDTLAIEPDVATLWFGYVLGEHSILGRLSDDCSTVEFDYP